MSSTKRAAVIERQAAEVQRYIRQRVALAMGDRSLNWLAKESGIPQSTLHAYQTTGENAYTIPALLAVAKVLRRPLPYFIPGGNGTERLWEEKDVAAVAAFHQVAELVDWWRSATPEEAAQARDVAGRVRERMGDRPAGPAETPAAPPASSSRRQGKDRPPSPAGQ
jgi:hypothetical protein